MQGRLLQTDGAAQETIHNNPVYSNILGNPGNPHHMISDAVDDVEACFQMVPSLLCFGVTSVNHVEKNQQVFKVHRISAPRWQHSASL